MIWLHQSVFYSKITIYVYYYYYINKQPPAPGHCVICSLHIYIHDTKTYSLVPTKIRLSMHNKLGNLNIKQLERINVKHFFEL